MIDFGKRDGGGMGLDCITERFSSSYGQIFSDANALTATNENP